MCFVYPYKTYFDVVAICNLMSVFLLHHDSEVNRIFDFPICGTFQHTNVQWNINVQLSIMECVLQNILRENFSLFKLMILTIVYLMVSFELNFHVIHFRIIYLL